MKKLVLIILVVSAQWLSASGQKNGYQDWCGTAPLAPEEIYQMDDDIKQMKRYKRAFSDTNIVIPVAFHIIIQTDGEGDITDAQIEAQIDELNFGFETHGFSFILASVDRTVNNNWFWEMGEREEEIKSALAIDPTHNLNIYSANLEGGLLGWAWYPTSWSEDSFMHGIVIHYGSYPGGWISDYDEGDVAVHEVGHYVGLAHTFENGCDAPGDGVDDTPYELEPTWTCDPLLDSCPQEGFDPVNNFMDYQDDQCVFEFSVQQGERAINMVNTYRPGLLNAYDAPDELDPSPPADFTAYSDYLNPTGVTLFWSDPPTLLNGDSIPAFNLFVFRNDVLLDQINGGVETFSDSGLIDGQEYSYSILASITDNDSISEIMRADIISGGSPIPSKPINFFTETVDSTVTLTWTIPTTQSDNTPLDDLAAVQIFRYGDLIKTLPMIPTDTGMVMTYVDNPLFGYTYDYQINIVDNELPVNESKKTETVRMWVGNVPEYLIWNPEGVGKNTANALIASFRELGLSAAEVDDLTKFGGSLYELGYKVIFVLCGVFPDVYEIWNGDWGKQSDLFKLNYFLNDGGSLYMEAGDEFSNYNANLLAQKFKIKVVDSGSSDLNTIIGVDSTFTEGMTFGYVGANLFTDHIDSLDGAMAIFENSASGEYNAVAYDAGSYRTIGASFEFGGLVDNGISQTELLEEYLLFLVDTTIVSVATDAIPIAYSLHQNYPNPFNPMTTIRFDLPKAGDVTLTVYDILGRNVAALVNGRLAVGQFEMVWNASDIASGIYFYRLTSDSGIRTKKLIILK